MGVARVPGRIERVGPADLMFLALQGATVPQQFGVVLVLSPEGPTDPAGLIGVLADRIPAVPCLRQQVLRVPLGCGRPIWVDDPTFTLDRHVEVVACTPPGDESVMLAAATELLLRRLPVDRPLWAARVLTGLTDNRVALVVVVQHALADGAGGLAVLGALVDGSPPPAVRAFPAPPPRPCELAVQAWAARADFLARLPEVLHRRRPQPGRAAPASIGKAPASSLMRPIGPRRRTAAATVQLESLRTTAHECGATVNDALVSVVAGALHSYLARRDQVPTGLVIGVPVAARRRPTSADQANAFTETRVLVSGRGDPYVRLPQIAAAMRQRKNAVMSPLSLLVAAPAVRGMVATGVYGWYMRRQRYLNTVLTNLRGPTRPLAFGGAPITRMLPLSVGGGGNVTVTFAALSYAGILTVMVSADPDAGFDLGELATLVQAELDALGCRLPATRPPGAGRDTHSRPPPHPDPAKGSSGVERLPDSSQARSRELSPRRGGLA